MLSLNPLLLTVMVSGAIALPANLPRAHHEPYHGSHPPAPGAWNAGAVTEYPIHPSCNATETNQLRVALHEMEILTKHAVEHALRWSNDSAIYRKYFGDAPSAIVIGNLERPVNANKANTLFRCDNPDGNCDIPGKPTNNFPPPHCTACLQPSAHPLITVYGGHWRGENGTDETVICPLSYRTRKPLAQLCALGYNVAEYPTNTYFASDLLHRIYHLPAITDWYVDHFAETYEEVLELAVNNNTYSVRDSDALQYFALEAYAYDITIPGVGCPGPIPSAVSSTETPAVMSATVTAYASASATP